jgi:hypothetical protein
MGKDEPGWASRHPKSPEYGRQAAVAPYSGVRLTSGAFTPDATIQKSGMCDFLADKALSKSLVKKLAKAPNYPKIGPVVAPVL